MTPRALRSPLWRTQPAHAGRSGGGRAASSAAAGQSRARCGTGSPGADVCRTALGPGTNARQRPLAPPTSELGLRNTWYWLPETHRISIVSPTVSPTLIPRSPSNWSTGQTCASLARSRGGARRSPNSTSTPPRYAPRRSKAKRVHISDADLAVDIGGAMAAISRPMALTRSNTMSFGSNSTMRFLRVRRDAPNPRGLDRWATRAVRTKFGNGAPVANDTAPSPRLEMLPTGLMAIQHGRLSTWRQPVGGQNFSRSFLWKTRPRTSRRPTVPCAGPPLRADFGRLSGRRRGPP